MQVLFLTPRFLILLATAVRFDGDGVGGTQYDIGAYEFNVPEPSTLGFGGIFVVNLPVKSETEKFMSDPSQQLMKHRGFKSSWPE